MNKVLNKRIFRDLKANFLRYLALFLLIVAGMFIVISIVGAAETIISGTVEKAKQNKLEDGQFSVFLPLTESQEKILDENGAEIEKMFSADIDMPNGSTLRVMKVRENINLINIDEGALPAKITAAENISMRFSSFSLFFLNASFISTLPFNMKIS